MGAVRKYQVKNGQLVDNGKSAFSNDVQMLIYNAVHVKSTYYKPVSFQYFFASEKYFTNI